MKPSNESGASGHEPERAEKECRQGNDVAHPNTNAASSSSCRPDVKPPKRPKPQPNAAETLRWFDAFADRNGVIEIRALFPRRRTDAGYFDSEHWNEAADALAKLNRNGGAPYITLNSIDPQLLARAHNRVKEWADATATDANVTRRRWILVDSDPKRVKGTSATDAQHDAALANGAAILDFLEECGIPRADVGSVDSGNGSHLLIPCDLPNDDDARELVKRFLTALAERFDDAIVVVDQSVFNAARIVKPSGIVANKGDDVDDMPHRVARIIHAPDAHRPVDRDVLENIAGPKPEPAKLNGNGHARAFTGSSTFDVRAFLTEHGVDYTEDTHEGSTRLKLKACPFDPSHTGGESAVFIASTGAIGFKCQHNSCSGYRWADVREKLEPGRRDRHEHRAPIAHISDDDERRADAAILPLNRSTESADASLILEISEPHPGVVSDYAPEPAPRHPLFEHLPEDRFTVAELDAAPPPVSCAVYPVLPLGKPSLLIAQGGAGKTGVALAQFAVPICTGGDFFGEPVQPGTVAFITAEDSRADLLRTLHENVAHLTERQRGLVADRLHVKDLTGTGFKLTARIDGRTIVTPETDALAEWAEGIPDLRLVVLDTLSRLHGGEESNDDLARFVEAQERIARRTGAAVLALHHTGKQQMREGQTDQYYSRGGSALSDNARSVINLSLVKADQPDAPTNAAELIADGRLLRLTHAKVNHTQPSTVKFIERAVGRHAAVMRPFVATFDGDTPERVWIQLGRWLAVQTEVPHPTQGTVDTLGDEFGTRARRRAAVLWALDRNLMEERAHPNPHGRRRTYLALTDAGRNSLESKDSDAYRRASRGA